MMKNILLLLITSSTISCQSYKTVTEENRPPQMKNETQSPIPTDVNGRPGNDQNKMAFSISMPTKSLKTDDVHVKLNFKNNTIEEIRVLDLFNMEQLKINFFMEISYADGSGRTESPIVGSFADFPLNYPFKYIVIPPQKTFSRDVNVSDLLKSYKINLPTGKYTIKMTYTNIYGRDCIKGNFQCNDQTFTIKE